MWDKVKQLFARKPAELKYHDPLLAALAEGLCPDCQGNEFSFGPLGGMAQNIRCAKCGSGFNVAPFDGGWCGEPMFAERIGAAQ